jgi:hypothetical protein
MVKDLQTSNSYVRTNTFLSERESVCENEAEKISMATADFQNQILSFTKNQKTPKFMLSPNNLSLAHDTINNSTVESQKTGK